MDSILSDDTGSILRISLFDWDYTCTLSELIKQLDLQQESIQIFGKTVLQPRLSAFYADEGISYIYSQRKFSGKPWTTELFDLKAAIEEKTSEQFNSVLVNYYRDGTDSMGLHADNERELGQNPIIASMNFGASRKMVFRKNGTNEKLEIELNDGDLLIMSGALQHNWKHEIPKQRKIGDPRLNLTFRKINAI